MATHNQLKKISTTPQANTIPYADENGYISNWLTNDPIIQSLQQQNELIGSVPTIPSGEDIQTYLSQYVYQVTGRLPRNGDEVAIEDVGELWEYNGTQWVFFTNTTLKDATTTSKGIMQVGTGLSVTDGVVSLDSTAVTASRAIVNNNSTTPSIAPQANTDYMFSDPLTSLTLTSVPNSNYYTSLNFTTGSTFTFTASTLTEWYFNDNPPTFLLNTKYQIIILNGKAYISHIGEKKNKFTAINSALTPVSNIATWTITNTLGTGDVFIRVYESATGNTVEVDSTVTASTITLKLYTDSVSIAAGTYTVVVLG